MPPTGSGEEPHADPDLARARLLDHCFRPGRAHLPGPGHPGRDADGRGRARTFSWPANAVEVEPDQLRDEHVDVVVLQRPHELELAEKWLGRRPGTDVPAVYVEHDTPRGE